MIAFLDRLNISLSSALYFFVAIFALGVLVMIALLVIRTAKPEVREDDALTKKWKRAFTASATLIVVPVLIMWRLIYRLNERTVFLEESDLFNSIFYYRHNILSIDPFFLLRVFTVLIVLGMLGIIALLIIRKVNPKIKEDANLLKKWKCTFTVSIALVLIPALIISIGS